jgi:hypothetical protein
MSEASRRRTAGCYADGQPCSRGPTRMSEPAHVIALAGPDGAHFSNGDPGCEGDIGEQLVALALERSLPGAPAGVSARQRAQLSWRTASVGRAAVAGRSHSQRPQARGRHGGWCFLAWVNARIVAQSPPRSAARQVSRSPLRNSPPA